MCRSILLAMSYLGIIINNNLTKTMTYNNMDKDNNQRNRGNQGGGNRDDVRNEGGQQGGQRDNRDNRGNQGGGSDQNR